MGFTTQGTGVNDRVVDMGDGTGVLQVASGMAQASSLTSAGNATGTAVDGGVVRNTATMVVTSGTGVSAGSVQMQGSLDGVSWYDLGSAVTTNAASTTFPPVVVTSTPARFLRAVSTGVTGGTVSAVVAMS